MRAIEARAAAGAAAGRAVAGAWARGAGTVAARGGVCAGGFVGGACAPARPALANRRPVTAINARTLIIIIISHDPAEPEPKRLGRPA